MAKLRIGIVIDSTLDRLDGVQQYVLALGDWLSGQGHSVVYLSGETDQSQHPGRTIISLAKNITVKGNKNQMSIPLFAKNADIQNVFDTHDFDVLHVQMPYHPLLAGKLIAAAPVHTAVVTSFHIVGGSYLINFGAKALALIQKRTNRRVDTYLSVSTAAKEFMHKTYAIDSVVSPNVVDVAKMKQGKSKPFLKGKSATIVFLGRLVERKGAQHLIEALKVLNKLQSLEGLLVHICGDGPLREALEQDVRLAGLDKQVLFHGFIPEEEKADYLHSADLAVFPATGGESFGIVLIEAMAAGTKVVLAGNNEGYATVMEGSKDQLFNPHDSDEFAHLIHHFLTDKASQKRAREWQKNRVKTFDVATVGPQVVQIYRDAIKTRT